MTDTKLNEKTQETSTVEVNQELQTAFIKSSKHKVEFIVDKVRSAKFFTIRPSKGTLPKELYGKFSSLEKAIETVQFYILLAKDTFSVRSDKLQEERQQRKHAESNTADS